MPLNHSISPFPCQYLQNKEKKNAFVPVIGSAKLHCSAKIENKILSDVLCSFIDSIVEENFLFKIQLLLSLAEQIKYLFI